MEQELDSFQGLVEGSLLAINQLKLQEVMQEEVEAEAYSCQGQVARSLQDCQQDKVERPLNQDMEI